MGNNCESLERHLESINVLVVERPVQEAKCIVLERGRLVGINSGRFQSECERCEALMHEESHFEGGFFYKPYSPYTLREQMEYKANKRMILKRIPEEEVNSLVRDGRGELWELAEHFCVTEEFMLRALLFYKERAV